MSNEIPPKLQLLVLERVDPARNMNRYYVLSVTPSLFGDIALVRERGRKGQGGQQRIELTPKRLGQERRCRPGFAAKRGAGKRSRIDVE